MKRDSQSSVSLYSAVALLASATSAGFAVCGFTLYGQTYKSLVQAFPVSRVKLSWIGSIYAATMFIPGSFTSYLAVKLGFRLALITGSSLFALGMLTTALSNNLYAAYVGFGILSGFGSSMLYSTSYMILPVYFPKNLTRAGAFCNLGACILTLVLPYFLDWLDENYGWQTMVSVYGSCALHICLLAMTVTKDASTLVERDSDEIKSSSEEDVKETATPAIEAQTLIPREHCDKTETVHSVHSSKHSINRTPFGSHSILDLYVSKNNLDQLPVNTKISSHSSTNSKPLLEYLSKIWHPMVFAPLWLSFVWTFCALCFTTYFTEFSDNNFKSIGPFKPSILMYIVMSLSQISGVFFCLWLDKLGRHQLGVMGLMGTLYGLGAVLFPNTNSLIKSLFFVAMTFFGNAGVNSLYATVCLLVVERHLIVYGFGMQMLMCGVGALTGPVVIGAIMDSNDDDYRYAINVLSPFLLSAGIIFLIYELVIIWRTIRRKTVLNSLI